MLRFDLSAVKGGTDATGVILNAYEMLCAAAAAQLDALDVPREMHEARVGYEPEAVYYGAAKITQACADALNYLLDNNLVEGRAESD